MKDCSFVSPVMSGVRQRKPASGTEGEDAPPSDAPSAVDSLLSVVAEQVITDYEKYVDPVADMFRYRSRPSKGELRTSGRGQKLFVGAAASSSTLPLLAHELVTHFLGAGSTPMVFLLGNHSSGKSSFVNSLTGINLQKTGVAPLDDAFTLITYGARESEQDGPAVVANTKLPFASLNKIEGSFINHLRLKMAPSELLKVRTGRSSSGGCGGCGRGHDSRGTDVPCPESDHCRFARYNTLLFFFFFLRLLV